MEVFVWDFTLIRDKQRQRLLYEHVAYEHKPASDNVEWQTFDCVPGVAGCGFAACCYY